MILSKNNKQLLKAYENGYRIIKGELFNPLNEKLAGWIGRNGYKVFHISKNGSPITFHRLVAYQKFGNKIFEKKIQVRHLDGNPLNNLDNNIEIGTQSDNMMDIPKKQRRINAGNQSRKHNYDEIQKFHAKHKSYLKTMQKFGITSKGTLNHILRADSSIRENI